MGEAPGLGRDGVVETHGGHSLTHCRGWSRMLQKAWAEPSLQLPCIISSPRVGGLLILPLSGLAGVSQLFLNGPLSTKGRSSSEHQGCPPEEQLALGQRDV